MYLTEQQRQKLRILAQRKLQGKPVGKNGADILYNYWPSTIVATQGWQIGDYIDIIGKDGSSVIHIRKTPPHLIPRAKKTHRKRRMKHDPLGEARCKRCRRWSPAPAVYCQWCGGRDFIQTETSKDRPDLIAEKVAKPLDVTAVIEKKSELGASNASA